jgi:uncharacterized protein YndB with AHSA1/START domain
MPMGGKYEEVSPIDKIVFTTTAFPNAEGVHQLQGHNVVLFTDEGKKTKIVLTASIVKAGPGLEGALAGMDQGWKESLDRLGELVEDTSEREMKITRPWSMLPRELLWKIWTDPEHIKEWWGPNGFTNTIHQFNLAPGW